MFLVETMGGFCGYLATVSAMASGADNAYIFEENFTVDDIKEDCKVIAKKMIKGVQRYLIIRNECANPNYTTQFIMQLFSEEGRGQFSTRINVLGHAQQGGSPTPFDRNMGTKLASRALEQMVMQMRDNVRADGTVRTNDPDTANLLGLQNRYVIFQPLEKLKEETNFEFRLPKEQWWVKLRPLLRILAQHDSIYETDAVDISVAGVEE